MLSVPLKTEWTKGIWNWDLCFNSYGICSLNWNNSWTILGLKSVETLNTSTASFYKFEDG